ncbi:MAG: tRNA (adenosine(37)-N6)-threonylcarbamoyltransferase complex dimerization subunit type 1 TsaB [Candidatus Dadabacteria bacterium]|nr:tRNA (adenosine(37)-N6)-threonylcarbamoyltransferase complex dimerization subunit type 1 TsaB [Candidatus Dadabacteria bacterium]NIQ14235.1 tRNA (adenosine(37)-N6)-threonylcarbamoyltransferase complex dimerization subunit type 1 TsaB [Candidatus Dadabacteria bacterium]
MKILGIETSTFAGSVALIENDKLLGEHLFNIGPKHNELLVPSIDFLLNSAGIEKEELSGIAVVTGPGSFTSLRVGVSTAKALSYSLGIKIVGISSLEVLAYNFFGSDQQICPIIDAKKNQVFYALYKNLKSIEELQKESLINPKELCKSINRETIFVGNGVEIYKNLILEMIGEMASFPPSSFHIGRASNCAILGREKLLNNTEDDCFNLLPLYLRKSEAELKKSGE